jgi:hypothetical protein
MIAYIINGSTELISGFELLSTETDAVINISIMVLNPNVLESVAYALSGKSSLKTCSTHVMLNARILTVMMSIKNIFGSKTLKIPKIAIDIIKFIKNNMMRCKYTF